MRNPLPQSVEADVIGQEGYITIDTGLNDVRRGLKNLRWIFCNDEPFSQEDAIKVIKTLRESAASSELPPANDAIENPSTSSYHPDISTIRIPVKRKRKTNNNMPTVDEIEPVNKVNLKKLDDLFAKRDNGRIDTVQIDDEYDYDDVSDERDSNGSERGLDDTEMSLSLLRYNELINHNHHEASTQKMCQKIEHWLCLRILNYIVYYIKKQPESVPAELHEITTQAFLGSEVAIPKLNQSHLMSAIRTHFQEDSE
eukprot:GHVH01004815.1.p1 GENE.GHVH01004815.1~~GHVH01004815.1.p1  ORF type:complete len:269 (+),score=47.09 GHVH01004815.1:44-808(+)